MEKKKSSAVPTIIALVVIVAGMWFLSAFFNRTSNAGPDSIDSPARTAPVSVVADIGPGPAQQDSSGPTSPSQTVSYTASPTGSPAPASPTLSPASRITSSLAPLANLSFTNDLVAVKYAWSYRGSQWTWELKIPKGLYDYYRALPRSPTKDYSIYATHPLDDQYINNLANSLKDSAQKKGYNEFQTISFAAAFVQSMNYTSDSVTTGFDEYPRYPIETLYDSGGDCEDTSILLAALLRAMNDDAVLLIFPGTPQNPGHAGVGVRCSPLSGGTSWSYNGAKYYYLETTGSGWAIGEIPPEYRSASAYVYPLIPVPILTHNWSFDGNRTAIQLTVIVDNLGSAAAQAVTVKAGFDAGGDNWWNSKESAPADIETDSSVTYTLNIKPPIGQHTRLLVRIMYQGSAVEESTSEWLDF